MKQLRIFVILAFIPLLFTSCEDYLDKASEEDITIQEAFKKRNYVEAFLSSAYAGLPIESYFSDMADINPFVLASDELDMPQPEKFGNLMNRGAMNAYNCTGRAWINFYESIRKCNMFLENIHLTPTDDDFTQKDKDTWIGEIIMLRAFYHFLIIRIYGPCIIMDHYVTPDEDFTQLVRSPLDVCVKFVCDEIDKAIPMLPMKITDPTKYGHLTAAVGYAVKSRLLLYRASDLWNGNPLYKGYDLFPQEKDPSWWEKAAEASRICIEKCEENGYQAVQGSD